MDQRENPNEKNTQMCLHETEDRAFHRVLCKFSVKNATKIKCLRLRRPPTPPGILRTIAIRCYSAGQTILPVPKDHPKAEDFKQEDARARRIEMRLTRLNRADNEVVPEPDEEE